MKSYTAIYYEDHQYESFIGTWLDSKICEKYLKEWISNSIEDYVGDTIIRLKTKLLNFDINNNSSFIFSSGTYIGIYIQDDIENRGLNEALRERKLERILNV